MIYLFRYCLYENVEIRLSQIRLWRFVQNCNHFGVQLSISSPLNDPSVTFHYDGLDTGVAFGFASTHSAAIIADEYRGIEELQACTPFFCGRSLGSCAPGVDRPFPLLMQRRCRHDCSCTIASVFLRSGGAASLTSCLELPLKIFSGVIVGNTGF